MLIAEASPGDRNAIKREAERIVKYKDVIIEIQLMWNVAAKVIPVIIGTTGTISESFRQYLRNVDRKHEIKGVQKTAILGTAHTLRKVLM
jgi:NDP-sugar pyrophosphorylase family protein